MTFPGRPAANTGRRLCGSGIAPDLDKAMVWRWIMQCAADGLADWEQLENGDIRLRFDTGETYLLAELGVLRLA